MYKNIVLSFGLVLSCAQESKKASIPSNSSVSTSADAQSTCKENCQEWEAPKDRINSVDHEADKNQTNELENPTYISSIGSTTQIESAKKCTDKGFYFDRSIADQVGDYNLRQGYVSNEPKDWPACNPSLTLTLPLEKCSSADLILKEMENYVRGSETNSQKIYTAYSGLMKKDDGFSIDQCLLCPAGSKEMICQKSQEGTKVANSEDNVVIVAAKYESGIGNIIRKIDLPASLFLQDHLTTRQAAD